MKRPSKTELKYMKMQREHNTQNLTWRQFYEQFQGKDPHWMSTTQYGGDWLDKIMGEI